jgi:hypothetical protein
VRYFVEDASFTVTFWPAGVKIVKPELETLETVPDDPPAAGPERALDAPLPTTFSADVGEVNDAVVAVPEPGVAVALTMP